MLVNFSFKNFRSYRDETSFSMVAGGQRSHKETLFKGKGMPTLLPTAAIYGGNASGKSNFFKALQALQEMVFTGDIISNPFLLDGDSAIPSTSAPSDYSLTFLADGFMWEYELSVHEKKVLKENLYRYASTKAKTKEVIYSRNLNVKNDQKSFSIGEYWKFPSAAIDALNTNGASLNSSALFLYVILSYDIPDSSDFMEFIHIVRNWICSTLTLVAADSRHQMLGLAMASNREAFSNALQMADTGISEINLQEDNYKEMGIPPERLQKFQESESNILSSGNDPSIFILKEVDKGSDSVQGYRCIMKHSGQELPYKDESDGTQRFLHLLPMLLTSSKKTPDVFVVDEIDRSLHPHLSRLFIQQHLDNIRDRNESNGELDKKTSEYNGQLIFTTHDVMLIDKELLRQDEIWVAERRLDHTSTLVAFDEFKEISRDKDMRSSYLLGRMGGIPHLGSYLK